MGMGEPLHNYDETMRALRMLNDEHGLGMSPRRVTLSTVGLLAGAREDGARADHCRTWRSRCTRRPTSCAPSWCR